MSDNYTPTTEEVRGHYAWKSQSITSVSDYVAAGEDFYRWLAERDQLKQAEGWDECVSALTGTTANKSNSLDLAYATANNPYRTASVTAPISPTERTKP